MDLPLHHSQLESLTAEHGEVMQKVFIKRTESYAAPPTGLLPGELAVEMATPTRLWVGVPISLDPTGKRLLVDLSASGGGSTVVIADQPPLGAPAGTLWWESDSGVLYINYNDGTSTQWVIVGGAGPPGPVGPTGLIGPVGPAGPPAQLNYARYDVGNVNSKVIDVPNGAHAVRLTAMINPSTSAVFNVLLQLSLAPGVFVEAGQYTATGFSQNSNSPGVVLLNSHASTPGIMLSAGHESGAYPLYSEGHLTLKRANAMMPFICKTRGSAYNPAGASNSFYSTHLSIAAGTQLEVLALRFISTSPINWAPGSYIIAEWF